MRITEAVRVEGTDKGRCATPFNENNSPKLLGISAVTQFAFIVCAVKKGFNKQQKNFNFHVVL
jgi:hypothetical protein